MKMVIIYTACGSMDEARKITDALIGQNIAACVNIMSPMTSVYHWKGKIEESNEIPMFVKTVQSHKDEALRIIREMHTYETPGIVCWDAESLHTDYSEWMKQNLKDFL